MPRIYPETEIELQLMSMASVFIEEGLALNEIYELLGPDLAENIESDSDLKEEVKKHITEVFLRLDMGWDVDAREEALRILENSWGVKTRESALKTLEDTRQQGHRVKFNVLKSCVSGQEKISAAALEKFKQIFKFDFHEDQTIGMTDDEYMQLAEWIKKTDRFVGDCGITAWDAARYVHLIRLSFAAGLIQDTEAWQEISKMGPVAIGKFRDWKEFALSFIIGRTFWVGEEDPRIKKCCERLLGDPISPWNFVPSK